MPIFSGGPNPRTRILPDYCAVSARPGLLQAEPSRLLLLWWSGLHALVASALLMTNPLWLAAASPLLALHAWRRRPVTVRLLVVSGGRFALPAEGRFDLTLLPAAGIGACCARLVFSDRPESPRYLIRDQLDAAGWRFLRLAIVESV